MEESAPAKLNLALHVRGREPDGYHRIETIFAFAEAGDLLRVEEGEGLTLSVTGPFAGELADEAGNLVLRAARALRQAHPGERGAALTLDKRLPVASGLGGGSADAAAALRLLGRWWGIGAGAEALAGIARSLGADVPACVHSRILRGEGRGDILSPLDLPGLSGTPVLLVNPRVPVATAQVFAAWDGRDRGPLPADWRSARNDLEAPATAVAPIIAEVLEVLRECKGASFVRMSGSGATCFALFAGEADRDSAAARLAEAHPGWWQLATRLL